MDVVGLTFDELCAVRQPRPHQVKALRCAYRAAQMGQGNAADLTGELLPIVRERIDGDTIKFVQRTADGLELESVIIPMRGWTQKTWRTLCVSSQIGCARGCTFCETAQLGLLRNLTAGEIVGQYLAARRVFGMDIRNVVFMGMGEPFDNYANVMQAVRILTDGHGLSLAAERITISTVGRIEGIRKLAASGYRRLNLAVSLNAPNDEIRTRIMPINALEPMAALGAALRAYPLRRCQFIMVEYVLIPGVNDRPEHAVQVAEFLRGLPSVLNVIPYNPRIDSPWPAATDNQVRKFLSAAMTAGQICRRRIPKGRNEMAACGQLGNRELVTLSSGRGRRRLA